MKTGFTERERRSKIINFCLLFTVIFIITILLMFKFLFNFTSQLLKVNGEEGICPTPAVVLLNNVLSRIVRSEGSIL